MMTTNEMFILRDALEKMSHVLDTTPEEILNCLKGILLSDEEVGNILYKEDN